MHSDYILAWHDISFLRCYVDGYELSFDDMSIYMFIYYFSGKVYRFYSEGLEMF